MVTQPTTNEEAQLAQTIEMFEVITQSQPQDYQSLEILKEAYVKLGREQDVINTSKRIAHAYVLMGQLSSAILEYESILQRFPDDPDALAALGEIESKANSTLNAAPATEVAPEQPKAPTKSRSGGSRLPQTEAIDDGRPAMQKIFVEGKLINAANFDACWVVPDLSAVPGTITQPFVQLLVDKGLSSIDKALRILSDKSRMGYIPLDRYEIDLEVARSFPADLCQRWCVLPFDRLSKSVLVATANPFNRQAALEFEQAMDQRILWYLAQPAEIIRHLKKAFR